jgi:hypothetical protein
MGRDTDVAGTKRNLAREWAAAQQQSQRHNYPSTRKPARTPTQSNP